MKKRIICGMLSAALLVTGCTNSSTGNNDKPNKVELAYSNLIDEKTQNEVKDILIENKIDKKQVEYFISNIKDYNATVGKLKTSKDGFTTIKSQQVPYDEEKIASIWQEKGYNYMDINCRLTSFILFKDYIKSQGKFEGDDIDLSMDLDTIKNNPIVKIGEDDTDKFTNLYSAIPVEKSTDINKHAEAIKAEWKKRNISFVENKNVSMINVFLNYAETNNVFVGHTGILVKTNDGLLFIEKYGVGTPYQVSKFKDREELRAYLMDRLYIHEADDGSSKPIIMENDELMK